MKKHYNTQFFYGILGLVLLAGILLYPKQSANGIWIGLVSCGKQIIPSLFPFFVISNLIIASPLVNWLGIAAIPFTKFALKIPGQKSATALLISWIGGFAVSANIISQLYEKKQISRRDALLLLVCGVTSGPAFVINAVGIFMLNSMPLGVCLICAMICANVCTALLFRIFMEVFKSKADESYVDSSDLQQNSIAPAGNELIIALKKAIDSTITVCGFVMFFRFICNMIASVAPFSDLSFFSIAALLEVTAGCTAASLLKGNMAVIACCVSLSIQSLSVLLQVKALLHPELSILPLILTRPIHLCFSLAFLKIFVHWIPGTLSAVNTLAPTVISTTRTAPDVAAVLFFLCCVVLYRVKKQEK